jgi:hypothetical protein
MHRLTRTIRPPARPLSERSAYYELRREVANGTPYRTFGPFPNRSLRLDGKHISFSIGQNNDSLKSEITTTA